jgi:hypothetical protein
MKKHRICSYLLLGGCAVYVLRRWGKRWGASYTETHASLPGDDIVPHPMLETTHAITIGSTPEEVWPWIVQMGYYRGGWYTDRAWWDYWSDRYLRHLVREEAERSGYGHRDEPSADRILEGFQQLEPGEIILDGPPDTAFFVVRAVEPYRLLALHSTSHLSMLFPKSVRENPEYEIGGEFSWAFILRKAEPGHTRLILRTRANIHPWLYRVLVDALIPFADWMMAKKMLTGIKIRAEELRASELSNLRVELQNPVMF